MGRIPFSSTPLWQMSSFLFDLGPFVYRSISRWLDDSRLILPCLNLFFCHIADGDIFLGSKALFLLSNGFYANCSAVNITLIMLALTVDKDNTSIIPCRALWRSAFFFPDIDRTLCAKTQNFMFYITWYV